MIWMIFQEVLLYMKHECCILSSASNMNIYMNAWKYKIFSKNNMKTIKKCDNIAYMFSNITTNSYYEIISNRSEKYDVRQSRILSLRQIWFYVCSLIIKKQSNELAP